MGRVAARALSLVVVVGAGGLAAGTAIGAPPPADPAYYIEADAGARDPRISLQVVGRMVERPRVSSRIPCEIRRKRGVKRENFSFTYRFQPAPIDRNGRFISERKGDHFHAIIAGQIRDDGIRGRTRLSVTSRNFNCDTGRIPFDLEQVSAERWERYRARGEVRSAHGRSLPTALRGVSG